MDDDNTTYAIEPFFYGRFGKRLYGCCHQPSSRSSCRGVVVLCQTIGQEYFCSHRAFFQLALRLASKGFITLRFDYFGCGDSEGNFEDGSIAHWLEDVRCSIEEMKIRTGSENISLLGYRLGASLALMTAMQSMDIKNLVLWETVTNGEDFLQELDAMQSTLNETMKKKKGNRLENPHMQAELLGFSFEPHLLGELKALHLIDCTIPAACNSLTIINQKERLSGSKPINHISTQNKNHFMRYIEDHLLWKHQLYKRLIPAPTLDAIVSWIEEVSP